MLVNHAVGLRLAALIIVSGVMETAIEADVQRPIALGTGLAKADALLNHNFPATVKTIHDAQESHGRDAPKLTIALGICLLA
jgi:hypothetical protein